jgi:hypothetical protein
MNTRPTSQYILATLLIFLILLTFAASVFYTFTVGKPGPALPPSPTFDPTSSATPLPPPASQYADQVHITDGVIVMGIIIVAIILFAAAWGRRMALRR